MERNKRMLFSLSQKEINDLEYLSEELAESGKRPNKSRTVGESISNRAIKMRSRTGDK